MHDVSPSNQNNEHSIQQQDIEKKLQNIKILGMKTVFCRLKKKQPDSHDEEAFSYFFTVKGSLFL